VPRQTFGIYLIHSIYLVPALDAAQSVLKRAPLAASSAPALVMLWAVLSVVGYTLCLMASDTISNTAAMRWSIGLAGSAQPAFSYRRSTDFIAFPAMDSSRAAVEPVNGGMDGLWAARLAGG
jgi:hypothetical protein